MASDWVKLHQKRLKARQSRQNQVYLAFSSQKQDDVRLASRRAPGVGLVPGFRMYLVPVLAPKRPDIPVFGKNPLVN